MSIVTEGVRYTPQDLLTMPAGKHLELVDGQLVEHDMSLQACEVAANVIGIVREHIRSYDLGGIYTSEVGYQCYPDAPNKVRRPDCSFIRKERLSEQIMTGHVPIPPDLAVEVVSPNDYYYEVLDKVDEYLQAGVRLVWVFNPRGQTIQVFRLDGTSSKVDAKGDLLGEDVLPGFRGRAAEFFETAKARGKSD
jgi:Uma2 family endonuclease